MHYQFLENWADTHLTALLGVLNWDSSPVTANIGSGDANDFCRLSHEVFCHFPCPSTCSKRCLWFCYLLQPLKFSYPKVIHGTSVCGWAICKLECWLYMWILHYALPVQRLRHLKRSGGTWSPIEMCGAPYAFSSLCDSFFLSAFTGSWLQGLPLYGTVFPVFFVAHQQD